MKTTNTYSGLQRSFLWSALLCIYAMTFSFQAHAQDEESLERTWYLYKLEMEGEEYLYYELDIDSGEESNIEIVLNDNSTAYVEMGGCPGWGCSSSFEFVENDNKIILGGMGCLALDHCNYYYNPYYDWPDVEEYNLMSDYYHLFYVNNYDSIVDYNVQNIDNVDYLIFTDEEDDKIYYSSVNLSTPDFEKLHFSLSPNPVQNHLFIQLTDFSSAMNLEVYDIQGRRINFFKIREAETRLDVSEYTSGMYFIKLTDTAGKQQIAKFMKK